MFYFRIFFRGNGGIKWDSAREFTDYDNVGPSGALVELVHGDGRTTNYCRHDFVNMYVMSANGDTLGSIRGTPEENLPDDKRLDPGGLNK